MTLRTPAWAVMLALFALTLTAAAQTPVTKVGVINMQEAINGTHDGQNATRELDVKIQARQKSFDQQQRLISQQQEQFNKQINISSADERRKMLEDIDQLKRKLERDMSDAKDELGAEQQRLLQGLAQKITPVINKYASDNGFTLVLDAGNPTMPVIYSVDSAFITREIIAQYDKANPGIGQPVTSKPATHPPAH